MKKVLMILGVVFLAVIVGFVLLLVWAGESSAKDQDRFFTAVLSGDPAKVMELIHPEMREEVDEPVLAAWMECVKNHLGSYKGANSDHKCNGGR